ncbi:MAG: hypothetical protein ACYS99_07720, partial [Planctomycetota bacterium]
MILEARRIPLLVALLLAACASSPPPYASPEALARQRARLRKLHELEAARRELRRILANESLVELAILEDPTLRVRAAERAYRLAPEVLTDLPPGEIATLAPDVLKVYHLGAVLDAGLDAPAVVSVTEGQRARVLRPFHEVSIVPRPGDEAEYVTVDGRHLSERDLTGEQSRPRDGGGALLGRIARLVEREVGDPGISFVAPAGEHLLVLASPESFAEVERSLDRHAVVGGPVLRVRAHLAVGLPVPTGGKGRFSWLEPGPALPKTAGRPLVFDVPYGRERGALRGGRGSYLADYEVHAGIGAADPIVARLTDGLCVNVAWGAYGPDGAAAAEIRVGEAALQVEPVPSFTTYVHPGAHPIHVRIQLPEVRVAHAAGRGAVDGS